MHKIIFATNNKNKLIEVQKLVSNRFTILSLAEMQSTDELPETHFTLQENAEEKAGFIFNKYKMNCFAEDTGMEIEILNGEPGVFSARYAGEQKSAKDNIEKVLQKMSGQTNRKAKFITVVCLFFNNRKYFFSGEIEGQITLASSGQNGFGYDPIFQPTGYDLTFAQMNLNEKNKISHRAIAIAKTVDFLFSAK